ncbi:MAG: dihydroneopterin aldolase [Chlamydiota bacterium]|nr:dihydroneopterin aldolase [Chlamydiota bacterium]
MIGAIGFDKLKIRCIIGVNPEERVVEQEIFVCLRVRFDFSKASASDCISDSVDYVRLSQICTDLALSNRYQLLEKFAVDILERVFSEFPVISAWVRIEKPQAIASADHACVELERVA